MYGFIDITGQKFGKLTVIERTEEKGGAKWLCRCDCGNTKVVSGRNLRCGITKSCGCLISPYGYHRSGANHKGERERLYSVWGTMIQRCTNPKSKHFANYGGRGVSVCEEWRVYSNFRKWAYENGYDDKAERNQCTIDRIDNNGDYCPENCRWVDILTQSHNSRRPKRVEYNGENRTLREWGELYGVDKNLIKQRLWKGWTPERAITTPKLATKERK